MTVPDPHAAPVGESSPVQEMTLPTLTAMVIGGTVGAGVFSLLVRFGDGDTVLALVLSTAGVRFFHVLIARGVRDAAVINRIVTTFVFIGIEGASVYSRYAVLPQPEIADTRQPSMVGLFAHVVGDRGETFTSIAVIVSVMGAYLGRGRGGGHCMTCPITRDPVDH